MSLERKSRLKGHSTLSSIYLAFCLCSCVSYAYSLIALLTQLSSSSSSSSAFTSASAVWVIDYVCLSAGLLAWLFLDVLKEFEDQRQPIQLHAQSQSIMLRFYSNLQLKMGCNSVKSVVLAWVLCFVMLSPSVVFPFYLYILEHKYKQDVDRLSINENDNENEDTVGFKEWQQ